jgi:hypothetical protein
MTLYKVMFERLVGWTELGPRAKVWEESFEAFPSTARYEVDSLVRAMISQHGEQLAILSICVDGQRTRFVDEPMEIRWAHAKDKVLSPV